MRQVAVGLVLITAACGAPMSVRYKGTSPQPLSLTLKCASAAADSLGYKARIVNHEKSMEAIRKDSALAPYEDSRQERITAGGKDAKSNDGSSALTVTGATFSFRWTRIGLERREIPASEKVKADAKTVSMRCGGATE